MKEERANPAKAPPVGAVDRLLQARARGEVPEPLHEESWKATKLAGDSKKSTDPAQGQQLLDVIDELGKIFWETKSESRSIPARPLVTKPGAPGAPGFVVTRPVPIPPRTGKVTRWDQEAVGFHIHRDV